MSAKCLDKQGRWRNKTVAFRVSPKEDELLETAVRLSGLTKQDYITRRLQEKEVVVTGNPRVYKALKNELAKVLILSILVDTFISKISLTMQPGPKIDSISGA